MMAYEDIPTTTADTVRITNEIVQLCVRKIKANGIAESSCPNHPSNPVI